MPHGRREDVFHSDGRVTPNLRLQFDLYVIDNNILYHWVGLISLDWQSVLVAATELVY